MAKINGSVSTRPENGKKLLGYGCTDCEWQTSAAPYFEALAKYGEHNSRVHGGSIHVHLTYIYESAVRLEGKRNFRER